MSDLNSDNEIELLTSINLKENSVEFIRNDLKLIENKLNSINIHSNQNEDNLLNVLEDCITDSTLSINQINNNSKNLINKAKDNRDKDKDDNGNKIKGKGMNKVLKGVMININESVDIMIVTGDLVKVLIKSQSQDSNLVKDRIEDSLFNKFYPNPFNPLGVEKFSNNFNFYFFLLLLLVLIFKS